MLTQPIFADRPWNAPGWVLDPGTEAVPTMLTPEEGRMLAWLTARWARGAGAVVDLGCFAGGSTARLAAGLRARQGQGEAPGADPSMASAAAPPGRVAAHDFFTVAEAHKAKFLYPAGIAPFAGADLWPTATALLAPWADLVDLRRGDIAQASWVGPIEVLFIDAAKSPQVGDAIAAVFFPHLIPGASVVVQQDYQHWRQPWVPVQMELLADCFALAGWTAENSVLWLCTRAPGAGDIAGARTAALDDATMTRLLHQAMARFADRGPRGALARAILGLADNPGQRNPPDFDRSRFTPARIRALMAAKPPVR